MFIFRVHDNSAKKEHTCEEKKNSIYFFCPTILSTESSKPVEPADFTPLSPPHSYLNGLETPRFSLCSYLSGTTTPAPQLGPETTPTSIPNTPHSKVKKKLKR